MKKLEEIKDQIAREHAYDSWDDLVSEYNELSNNKTNRDIFQGIENEAMHEYATQYHSDKLAEVACSDNKKELDKVFSQYDNALKIENEIKSVLNRFNTEQENVDEILFNVYPDEMHALVKHFTKHQQQAQEDAVGFALYLSDNYIQVNKMFIKKDDKHIKVECDLGRKLEVVETVRSRHSPIHLSECYKNYKQNT